MRSVFLMLIALLSLSMLVIAQRPRIEGPPEWAKIVDVNKNGRIESDEFREAAETFFQVTDGNKNGIIELSELPARPGGKPGRIEKDRVPPFLFLEFGDIDLNREAFLQKANQKFARIDVDGDRTLDWEEIKVVRPENDDRRGRDDRRDAPNGAMAKFVGSELRFGDKLVKGAPFSAETVREESKRLFDGSLVKSQSKGEIYRDGEGRVRQEMPFDSIAGFPVMNRNDQPLRLVHIVDHVAGKTYSLNTTEKTYFNIPFKQASPLEPKNEPREAKKEALGKQTIEGVTAEGTRITIEIPVGEIGNDKPINVVTEKWYSPELQMIILSKHTDPFIGEVIFRLVNIKLGEPAAELFKIPADYKETEARPKDERRPQPDNRRPQMDDRRPPMDGRRPVLGDRRPPMRP
ncbi:MAG: hypothetical protein IPN69_21830 [Acidobacteria bacterium]|nr:hypothetical protein [Acidobacteriota bacterium]